MPKSKQLQTIEQIEMDGYLYQYIHSFQLLILGVFVDYLQKQRRQHQFTWLTLYVVRSEHSSFAFTQTNWLGFDKINCIGAKCSASNKLDIGTSRHQGCSVCAFWTLEKIYYEFFDTNEILKQANALFPLSFAAHDYYIV